MKGFLYYFILLSICFSASSTKAFAFTKDTIHLVALLPLNHTKVMPKQVSSKERKIYDLLAGMETARSIMNDTGALFSIHYYDTEGSTFRINQILSMPELKQADAIIGPIFGAGTVEVADFALKNNITLLNPLSPKLYWGEENNAAFITGITAETFGKTAALFALKSLPSAKCAIIYGTTTKDSLMAKAYYKVMQDSGRNIVLMRKVGKNSAANLPKFLLQSGLDSTGHVFAPSTEPIVEIQLPGTIQLLHLKTPIIALGSWIENTQIEYRDWENLGGYFLWPDFQDFNSAEYAQFTKKYKEIYNLVPSTESSIGFESVYQVVKGLRKYGRNGLANYWHAGTEIKTALFTQWKFGSLGDNTYLPIYQLVETGPKRVN